MKIKSNGLKKEITVLKHFKVILKTIDDEYILYKEGDKVRLGYIVDNKITTPLPDKMGVVKVLIGNFISNNYNDKINIENNCTVLSNEIEEELEEVSSQYIKFTDTQLSNLTRESKSTFNAETDINVQHNNRIIALLIVIIIALVFILIGLLTKKIKNPLAKTKVVETKETSKDTKTTKYKKDAKLEELLERMNEATYKADADMYISAYPDFMKEEVKQHITNKVLKEQYNKLKQEYGEDAKVTYNITKQTKKEDSWMVQNNEYLQDHYKTTIKMTECYELEGTITKTGSLKTDVIGKDGSTNPFYEVWYCKFSDGTTGIITG